MTPTSIVRALLPFTLLGVATLATAAQPQGTPTKQAAKAGTSRPTAKLQRDATGQPVYLLTNGTRVSCRAERGTPFDCSLSDAKGRPAERGGDVWLARIEPGRSLTVTAIGRRPRPGDPIPGSGLVDLARIAAAVAKARAEEEAERERREALLEEAIRSEVSCEMCNWSGECWNVPCTLPPTKE